MPDSKGTTSSEPTISRPDGNITFVWKHYIDLARMRSWPMGSDLVWYPSMWGLLMNAYHVRLSPRTVLMHAIVHAVACTFAHSAACIWNDICDRDFDRHVERTKARPITQGLISVSAAFVWLEVHAVGYFLALAYFGRGTLLLGVVLFFTVTPLYPLSKRLTNWPQAVLGVNCAWCALLGWYAVDQTLDWRVTGPLCSAMFCWTVHYDTIYASPDKKYDEKIGVHSTARLFGDYIRPILFVFCAGFVASLAYAGYVNQQGPIYYVVDVAFTASVLLWQLVMTGDFEKDGSRLYRANGLIGYATVIGLLADYVYEVLLCTSGPYCTTVSDQLASRGLRGG